MICLVRHARAASKSSWHRPDRVRPLSRAGRAEADGLVTQLGDRHLAAVLSSPSTRCVQTVSVLASRIDLPVQLDGRLGRDATVRRTLALLAECDDDAVTVLCTHGGIIRDVLEALRQRGAPIPRDARRPKAGTWLLTTAGHAITDAVLLPPPPGRGPRLLLDPPDVRGQSLSA